MDNETIERIFEENLAVDIISAERCGMGIGNFVYVVSDDKDKYILRSNTCGDTYAETVHWLTKLRELEIPVPEILSCGKYEDFNFVILSYIEGDDLGNVYGSLSREDKRSIAKEVVRMQDRVSALELTDLEDGWSWNACLDELAERAKERIEKNGYFDSAKVDELKKLGGDLREYFDNVKPTAYLDDISTKNLLIKDGKVSGVIDVDWIGIGDRLTFAALTNTALLFMGCDTEYVDFLLEEMNADKKVFIYYSLLFCVDFMGERGTTFLDKTIEVNDEVIERLNGMYNKLMDEWTNLSPDRRPNSFG